jgi:hypothetical protein
MKLAARILGTMAIAFVIVPAVYANDDTKSLLTRNQRTLRICLWISRRVSRQFRKRLRLNPTHFHPVQGRRTRCIR